MKTLLLFAESTPVIELGIPLAITGMLIVFLVLVFISLFIASLPRILDVVNQYLPESEGHHGHGVAAASPAGPADDVVAAIAVAMHRQGRK